MSEPPAALHTAGSRDAPAADILVVCTANQARSPVAAALLRRESDRRTAGSTGVVIASTGVHADAGAPLLASMASALAKRGIAVPEHRSQQFTVEALRASGLVIAMTEAHRHLLTRAAPETLERTFTLREIVRLTSSEYWEPSWDGSKQVVSRLHRLRPLVAPAARPEDVQDPVSGGRRLALSVLDDLVRLTGQVAQPLFGRLA